MDHTDVLFTFIGVLLSVIYADLRHQLKAIRNSAHWRDRQIYNLSTYMRQVCRKLNIPYREEQDDDNPRHRRHDDPQR